MGAPLLAGCARSGDFCLCASKRALPGRARVYSCRKGRYTVRRFSACGHLSRKEKRLQIWGRFRCVCTPSRSHSLLRLQRPQSRNFCGFNKRVSKRRAFNRISWSSAASCRPSQKTRGTGHPQRSSLGVLKGWAAPSISCRAIPKPGNPAKILMVKARRERHVEELPRKQS